MNMKHDNSYDDFSENPLAPLFYQFIDILKSLPLKCKKQQCPMK